MTVLVQRGNDSVGDGDGFDHDADDGADDYADDGCRNRLGNRSIVG